MALSDLAVFSEQLYSMMTEITAQQIDLFNAASRGAIALKGAAHQGDYSDKAYWQKIGNLVRRRNPYGSGAVAAKRLVHLTETMVKVASGAGPVAIDPGEFKWIQRNPEEGAAIYALQMSKDMLADMLNTGIMAGYAAINGVTALKYDGTGDTVDTMNARMLNKGAAKFGDRSAEIAAWVMHSTPLHDFYDNALANSASLFTYGTVNVIQDPFGRVFVVSDVPSLVTSGTPNIYNTLGLVPGAISVDQNNDFTDNVQTSNGDENILRTYQAEWSYQLGVKGFTWDKTNGGHAPNDAAIATSTNWDKIATSVKDCAGVLILCN